MDFQAPDAEFMVSRVILQNLDPFAVRRLQVIANVLGGDIEVLLHLVLPPLVGIVQPTEFGHDGRNIVLRCRGTVSGIACHRRSVARIRFAGNNRLPGKRRPSLNSCQESSSAFRPLPPCPIFRHADALLDSFHFRSDPDEMLSVSHCDPQTVAVRPRKRLNIQAGGARTPSPSGAGAVLDATS